MSNSISDEAEVHARNLIRLNFSDPDQRVESCQDRDCDIPFIGMTAEDYAVHLIEEHPYYRRGSDEEVLEAVYRATTDSENTGE